MKETPKLWLPDPGDVLVVEVSKDGVEVTKRTIRMTLRPVNETKTGFEDKRG